MVKNLPTNAGGARDSGSIPGSGRSPGGGYDNPLQYSCLENPMDRGTWWVRVHGVAESDMTEYTHMLAFIHTQIYFLWGRDKVNPQDGDVKDEEVVMESGRNSQKNPKIWSRDMVILVQRYGPKIWIQGVGVCSLYHYYLYCIYHMKIFFYIQYISESHSVVSNSLRPHGLYSPWNSPGQNTGVGSQSLLQGIFLTQRLNPGWILY